jgi:oligopeptide/dipeptide ABC transporter ATP-binding protein
VSLLKVNNLCTHFFTDGGVVLKAVDGISFEIGKGEILGIVGESGSGKSVTALSILGLIPSPGKVIDSKIYFDGKNLCQMEENELRKIRGNQIGMIFQDPSTSMDPSYTIGYQLVETIRCHKVVKHREALTQALSMMSKLNIPQPDQIAKSYSHQLSGGMIQRVMIALALLSEPRLLIADEPTTALDATVQFQILDLVNQIRVKFNTAVMVITHDFGVIAMLCDRVAVMYAGKIVESSDKETVLERPSHPYSQALINSVPKLGKKVQRLYQIDGQPPDLTNLPDGCSFAARCPEVYDRCLKELPVLTEVAPKHLVSCHRRINSNA